METVKLEKPQWIERYDDGRQYLVDEYFTDNLGRQFFHVLKEHEFGTDDDVIFDIDKWEMSYYEYKIHTYERLEDTPERKKFNYLSGLAKSLTERDIIAIANLFSDNCEDGDEIIAIPKKSFDELTKNSWELNRIKPAILNLKELFGIQCTK